MLFLASQASDTLDLILPYLTKKPSQLKVAFIPTAANTEYGGDPPWIVADRNKLKQMGFNVFDLDIEGKTESQLTNALIDADIILVGGGNTFYLLDKVLKSGFDKVVKKLIDRGVIYIGSSAGSVLMAPNIESVRFFDDPDIVNLSSYEGLNMVDFVMLPHYVKGVYFRDHERTQEEYKDQYKFLVLTNDQAVVVEKDGEYKVVEN